MRLKTSRLSAATAAACAAALVLGGTSVALAQGNNGAQGNGQGPSSPPADSTAQGPSTDTEEAMVVLSEDPLATAVSARTANGRVALGSPEARAHRQRLNAERNAFRAWLRDNAPKASVVGSHDVALNAVSVKLNGESLAMLRRAPQVTAAQFQGLYYPLAHDVADGEDPQLALINATEGWEAAGGDEDAGRLPSDAGRLPSDTDFVKVGIVDSGIDVGHPCFDDGDYPSGLDTQSGSDLTNNKVIVANVYSNQKHYRELHGAIDKNGHGTHVAGTVACNFETDGAQVDGAEIPYAPSGVAPAALLGNYNVFPGPGGSARSEDILNALEDAYADGMDLVNMSLGGGASGYQDLLTVAVDNLDQAGMISVVAQGNDGPNQFTVGSPGSAERALTVGASSVGHLVASFLQVAGERFLAVRGEFGPAGALPDLPLSVVTGGEPATELSRACTDLAPGDPALGDLSDSIAVVARGTCTFAEKEANARAAGAEALIVVNNATGDPITMGGPALEGNGEDPIPAYMVGLGALSTLKADDVSNATITAPEYAATENDLLMAAFSSGGPTDVDWRVKPDVVAPGVNVLSAQPATSCDGDANCWAFYQGTSMATPHVAGAVATVIDAFVTQGRDDYTSEEIRSAVVNTATWGVLKQHDDPTAAATDVTTVGAGQLDLEQAVKAELAVGPVSTSFGRVPAGSGQTLTKSVRLTNLTDGEQAVTVEVDNLSQGDKTGEPATFSVDSGLVTVGEDAATVRVTVQVPRGARRGDHQGMLRFRVNGTEVAHSPVYVNVK